MFLAFLPAIVLGLFFGRIWASFYRVRGPRKQPQATFGGLITTVLGAGFSAMMTSELLQMQWASGSLLWGLVAKLVPFYTPLIIMVAALVAHMSRRRAQIRHRARGGGRDGAGAPSSGVSDTPSSAGNNPLG
jgi:hypothetical protein